MFKVKFLHFSPSHPRFTKGATELCHLLIEADRGEKDRARLHFLFFYVCSANRDQFYYISFIRGNHLGPHYNKHIGSFPLLKPLLAALLRIIYPSDKSTTCQQTGSVCTFCPHPTQNAVLPRCGCTYQRGFCRKS